ncbi:MAG TPA: glycoside hydrolase family 127 protein, partial [Candidatus Paceibacterota bacterium]|nr:glycoside hydrolase family 127 protein [Candidatus Paceibacterota bacterium]
GVAIGAESPFAKVEPLSMNEVHWTDGFWADWSGRCRAQMVPGMMRLMAGTNYTQFLRNFEIVAGLAEGRARGASFNDGDFYKFLEGASATLVVTNDATLRAKLDDIIAVIARAQNTNGYIDTWVQLRQRETNSNVAPFRDRGHWEVYNIGQLLTAASVHYRVTGQTNFLNVARKAADCLDEVFAKPTPELAAHEICPSHYMGIIDLYRATGEPRYLALAKRMFAMRDLIKDGTADNQDRIPFAKQTEAEGHAVRANYLYAGAADLLLETGDTNLWKSLAAIWTNVVTKKLCITGGCGALYDGASPDGAKDQRGITKVHQSYGRNFQLPNTTAHNETCANIGNVLWNWRMFLATGEAKFMDVVELTLYNGVLCGVGLDGTNYFYTNPLRVTDPMPLELRWSRTRVPFVGSFCCPPNVVRTIAESSGYAYTKSGDTIWINLYGGSVLETSLANGDAIKLAQETEFPWSGRVRIKVESCGNREFVLKLRIPGWAKTATMRINNAPAENLPSSGGYVELRRAWKPGDFVDLDLPMPAELIEANPLVEETLNQVAVRRGPVTYCLESVDLPKDIHLSEVFVPENIQLRARYDSRLLGGVVVVEGGGVVRRMGNWSGRLYREVSQGVPEPVRLKLIPYFVWANRGASEMTVWLPRINL